MGVIVNNIEIKLNSLPYKELKIYLNEIDNIMPQKPIGFKLTEYADKLFKHATIFAAYSGNELVGLLCGYFNDFKTKKAYISHLSVKEKFQRLKIGTLLIEHAHKYAEEYKFKTISLEVLKNNDIGKNFYSNKHYSITEIRGKTFLMTKVISKINLLITGANGVLAKKIIKYLSQNSNYKIFASTRDVARVIEKINNINYLSNQEIIETDFLQNVEYVLHTAFPRLMDEKSIKEGSEFFKTLLHKCREFGVENFINISSQDVYGAYRETASIETTPTKPENEYAKAKLTCESWGLNIASNFMNYTNIRLGSLIGIEYKERIINKMIKFALQNKQINVQHSNNAFNFLDVQDAVEALACFIINSNPNEWQEWYNLGQIPNIKETTLFIANCIKKICNEKGFAVKVNVESEDANISRLLNSDSFYNASNWQPRISLEESIRKIFDDIYVEFLSTGGIEWN